MNFLKSDVFVAVYDNSGMDAWVPELWSNETLAILMENMVAGNLVHRDFENELANFGDVVNTRKPGEFDAERKDVNDDVLPQGATATNVPVPLNQHIYVAFLIRDGEETKSFKSLVDEYLRPAAMAMARRVDRIVLGQVYQFLENQAGTLGGLTNSNAAVELTQVRGVMNQNKAYVDGRNLILTSAAETLMLQNDLFISADKVGDTGTALREASLGRKFGFDIYMCQNASSVSGDASLGSGTINAGNFLKGSTSLTVTGFGSGEVVPGQWIKVAGNVYHVTATDNATATLLTLEYGLVVDAATNSAISVYDSATVVGAGTYAAGYDKHILVTISGKVPEVGQLVTFATDLERYTVVKTDGSTYIELDRPLDATITTGDSVNLGPSGDFNFAFHRNALALVIRPLALPRAGTGALSGVANFGGLSMRTTITYDGTKQGHLVTLDFLMGIAILDTDLGAVLLT